MSTPNDEFEKFRGTMPVQERLRIDADRLALYLRDYIPDFPASITLEQFKGGQSNPTYLITAGERRFVQRHAQHPFRQRLFLWAFYVFLKIIIFWKII